MKHDNVLFFFIFLLSLLDKEDVLVFQQKHNLQYYTCFYLLFKDSLKPYKESAYRIMMIYPLKLLVIQLLEGLLAVALLSLIYIIFLREKNAWENRKKTDYGWYERKISFFLNELWRSRDDGLWRLVLCSLGKA